MLSRTRSAPLRGGRDGGIGAGDRAKECGKEWAAVVPTPMTQSKKSLFGSFSSEKELLHFLSKA
jgi:hypothetical protein